MEYLLNRYVILKLCAYGNIDFDFIFSFWLRILIELQGSHDYHRLTLIKSQTQFPEVSTQSILPSFNEKRKVTNFIYMSGYWKIPLVSFGSAFNSQYFMRVILSERDFFSSHEVTFRSYGGKCDVFWEILLCVETWYGWEEGARPACVYLGLEGRSVW